MDLPNWKPEFAWKKCGPVGTVADSRRTDRDRNAVLLVAGLGNFGNTAIGPAGLRMSGTNYAATQSGECQIAAAALDRRVPSVPDRFASRNVGSRGAAHRRPLLNIGTFSQSRS